MNGKRKRHSIDQTVRSLLPESVRKDCLMKLRESIIRANEGGSNKWGVYHNNSRIRLLVGSLIIFTIERKGIWLALDNEFLEKASGKLRMLEDSPNWLWATKASEYPIYKAIPSRNGYYIPSEGESEIWPVVRELHYEFIGKAISKYSQLRYDSQAHHEPELLQYLSRELGQSVPEPDYTAISEVSVEQNKVWFFQSNPNRYRLLCALSDPEMQTMYWQVNQHRKEIRQGDTALIWMSGDNAGIYAVAEVISDPVLAYDADEYWIDENDKNAKKLRVKIRITSSLVNRPILRSELSDNDQLRNLSILRFAQGTNFSVTNSEWEMLRQEHSILEQDSSSLKKRKANYGEKLNKLWKVGAKHSLYSEAGTWYHVLRRFPGALFDAHGYILFRTKDEYLNCGYIRVTERTDLPADISISDIPGYVKVIDDFILPEESEVLETFSEGARHQITVNTYERSSEARKKCIDHYGAKCVVCGFDFSEKYGEIGAGLIHVHHLVPLSEIDEKYSVDPIRDLRPVCPNCHAIMHKQKPAFTVEEVREFIAQVTKSAS